MLIPGIIYIFIFNYIPMYGVTIAFKDFYASKGILGSPWVGLEHFKKSFPFTGFPAYIMEHFNTEYLSACIDISDSYLSGVADKLVSK